MKSILFIILFIFYHLILCIKFGEAQDRLSSPPLLAAGKRIKYIKPSTTLSSSSSNTPQNRDVIVTPPPVCDTTQLGGAQCADDCSTILVCTVDATPLYFDKCSNIMPDSPYCVKQGCSKIPDLTNPNCQSEYQCTSDGAFPDPYDCTIFHNCVNGVAETFQCPPTYTYISSIKTCRRTSECQKVKCPAGNIGMFTYEYDKAYFGVCFVNNEGIREIIMMKCPNEIDQVYVDGACIYNCKGLGTFVNSLICNKYNICYKESGKYQSVEITCGPGFYFDKARGQCSHNNNGQCVL